MSEMDEFIEEYKQHRLYRDPERIDRILEKIRKVWIGYPDVRLMQLLCNIDVIDSSCCYSEDGKFMYVGAFYNIEDTEVEEALDKDLAPRSGTSKPL